MHTRIPLHSLSLLFTRWNGCVWLSNHNVVQDKKQHHFLGMLVVLFTLCFLFLLSISYQIKPLCEREALLSTSSFWVWVAPSTTLTLWSLSRNCQRVLILRVKKLASKLHMHSVDFAAKLVHTRRALSSTVINSHQEPVSGQTCNPPDPHWFFPFFFAVEELYGTRYQSCSFSLFDVGSGFPRSSQGFFGLEKPLISPAPPKKGEMPLSWIAHLRSHNGLYTLM